MIFYLDGFLIKNQYFLSKQNHSRDSTFSRRAILSKIKVYVTLLENDSNLPDITGVPRKQVIIKRIKERDDEIHNQRE